MTRGKQLGLAKAMEALARNLDRRSEGRLLQERVASAWRKVAGPSVTGHTARAHLRDGELVVYVDSPVWATELSALAGPYAEALNKELGKPSVRSVRFDVSRKVAVDKALQREDEMWAGRAEGDGIIPVPLSEVELAQVRDSASGIPDERLRDAVVRATVAGMEWEKGRKAAKSRQKASGGL